MLYKFNLTGNICKNGKFGLTVCFLVKTVDPTFHYDFLKDFLWAFLNQVNKHNKKILLTKI